MVEVRNLTKKYGAKKAVNNISFTVNEGEILGFLGPNGAGKTTTMNILTGYISSSEGEVLINGISVLDDAIKAKKQIGYLPEQPPLYMDMTVKDYLDFVYDLKGCDLPRRTHINEICELVKITDVYNRIIKNLSKGYKQRVGLAQSLIGNPKVLILDEPTVGLDPKQIIEIRELIKSLGENRTVILSSHILPEIQAVCDRIVVINKGVIAADDSAEKLLQKFSDDSVLHLAVEGITKDVADVLSSVNGVAEVKVIKEHGNNTVEYFLTAQEGKDVRRDIFNALAERNMPILMLKSSGLSLEEIFIKLTSVDYTEQESESVAETETAIETE